MGTDKKKEKSIIQRIITALGDEMRQSEPANEMDQDISDGAYILLKDGTIIHIEEFRFPDLEFVADAFGEEVADEICGKED